MHNLFIDSNLILNLKDKQLMTLSFDLEKVFNVLESEIEKFLFLVRRSESKAILKNYLIDSFSRKIELELFVNIWKRVIDNYIAYTKEM
jgi:hypothetical protein